MPLFGFSCLSFPFQKLKFVFENMYLLALISELFLDFKLQKNNLSLTKLFTSSSECIPNMARALFKQAKLIQYYII